MSEALPEMEQDLFEETAGRPAPFYVVANRKFIVLFVATMGLYGVYWQYKQWSCVKAATQFESNADISPVMRAIFSVFFFHSLFGEVKQHSRGAANLAGWRAGTHATLLVIAMLICGVVARLAWLDIGGPIIDYVSLATMIPLLILYYSAQKVINLECGDPGGTDNRKLGTANYVWIVIGMLCWLLLWLP